MNTRLWCIVTLIEWEGDGPPTGSFTCTISQSSGWKGSRFTLTCLVFNISVVVLNLQFWGEVFISPGLWWPPESRVGFTGEYLPGNCCLSFRCTVIVCPGEDSPGSDNLGSIKVLVEGAIRLWLRVVTWHDDCVVHLAPCSRVLSRIKSSKKYHSSHYAWESILLVTHNRAWTMYIKSTVCMTRERIKDYVIVHSR